MQAMQTSPSRRCRVLTIEQRKNLDHFSICACHPCAGAMLIFSVSFQFYRVFRRTKAQNKFAYKGCEFSILTLWVALKREFGGRVHPDVAYSGSDVTDYNDVRNVSNGPSEWRGNPEFGKPLYLRICAAVRTSEKVAKSWLWEDLNRGRTI
jgi:hypothetical protein